MADLLRVENLCKTYPGGGALRRRMPVLSKVSLQIGRGQTLGLVGESGSGKSTLGRCILGLTRPDSGQVIFDGAEVQGLTGAALQAFRRRVQPVFQDPFGSLDPRWPVGRSVREALDCFQIGTQANRARRVLDLFDRVGLDPAFASRLPAHLSGGQRQRVAIAAALASAPDLIISDEPVSALDMSVQAQILNLFQDLQDDLGVAALFISHDLGVVDQVIDLDPVKSNVRHGRLQNCVRFPVWEWPQSGGPYRDAPGGSGSGPSGPSRQSGPDTSPRPGR